MAGPLSEVTQMVRSAGRNEAQQKKRRYQGQMRRSGQESWGIHSPDLQFDLLPIYIHGADLEIDSQGWRAYSEMETGVRVARKSVLGLDRQAWSVAVPESLPWKQPCPITRRISSERSVCLHQKACCCCFYKQGDGLYICEFCGEGGLRPPVRQLLGPLSLAS